MVQRQSVSGPQLSTQAVVAVQEGWASTFPHRPGHCSSQWPRLPLIPKACGTTAAPCHQEGEFHAKLSLKRGEYKTLRDTTTTFYLSFFFFFYFPPHWQKFQGSLKFCKHFNYPSSLPPLLNLQSKGEESHILMVPYLLMLSDPKTIYKFVAVSVYLLYTFRRERGKKG